MAEIRDPAALIAMLENGELANDLRKEIRDQVAYLHEHAGSKGKAKGTITLVMGFNVQGASLTIETDISVKKPKKLRASTTVFCTAEGALLTGHPRQTEFEMGPRSVDISK